jgi:hypothetical protein
MGLPVARFRKWLFFVRYLLDVQNNLLTLFGMSNAAASVALPFAVIRRCPARECERGCNCDRVPVEVDVDELTAVEVAHFQAHGSAAQRAEILSYFTPEVPMFKPVSKCSAPALFACGPSCPCSECMATRMPSSCPEGCDCLVCLVDSLSANPPPRRAVAVKPAA